MSRDRPRTPSRASKRLFSDKEISEVLRRAALLQQSQGKTSTHGLTISELKVAAEEVGIDPQWVDVAIRDIDYAGLPTRKPSSAFWGVPLTVERERWVEGVFPTERWSDVVAFMRRTTSKTGDLEQIGSHLEWRANAGPGAMHLVVNPREEQTRVTMDARIDNLTLILLPVMFTIMISFIVAITQDWSVAANLLFTLGLNLSVGGVLYGAARRALRKQYEAYLDLFDQVVARVEDEAQLVPAKDGAVSTPDATGTSEAASSGRVAIPQDDQGALVEAERKPLRAR